VQIKSGDAQIVLTGGAENMSQTPFALYDSRFGTKFGTDPPFVDVLWHTLTDSRIKTPMAITAENLAVKYDISRQQCDDFALASQKRHAAAKAAGVFDAELVAVDLETRKGVESFNFDEHARRMLNHARN
jgi:acetyl-CoA acyltransferase 2